MATGGRSEWTLNENESAPFFRQAWEAGFNFYDTADIYSLGASEEVTGRALRALAPRDALVVATKVFMPMSKAPNGGGLSRKHILSAIDASLKRLGMDYVDLYQIHRFDAHTPIEETMEALHDVVKAGKARYIGASSMFTWQFQKMNVEAERRGWTPFVCMQPQYNLVYREEEREMLPFCKEEGIGVIPWSPLARGFLAGNRKKGGGGDTSRANTDAFAGRLYGTDADFDVVDAVAKVAERRGVKPMQVALAWVLSNPAVTAPIIGASKPHHIADALGALEMKLDEEDMKELTAPYRAKPVLDHNV